MSTTTRHNRLNLKIMQATVNEKASNVGNDRKKGSKIATF